MYRYLDLKCCSSSLRFYFPKRSRDFMLGCKRWRNNRAVTSENNDFETISFFIIFSVAFFTLHGRISLINNGKKKKNTRPWNRTDDGGGVSCDNNNIIYLSVYSPSCDVCTCDSRSALFSNPVRLKTRQHTHPTGTTVYTLYIYTYMHAWSHHGRLGGDGRRPCCIFYLT